MKKLIRKGILLGLGVTAITREKMQKYAKELVKEGAINEKEGKKLVIDILCQAGKQRNIMQHKIETEVIKIIKKNKSLIAKGEMKFKQGKIRVLKKLKSLAKEDRPKRGKVSHTRKKK